MLRSERFDIPPVDYFQCKNCFSGNIYDFNYKIIPEEQLKVILWFGKLCSEKSDLAAQAAFPPTESGREELLAWLEKRYQIFAVDSPQA